MRHFLGPNVRMYDELYGPDYIYIYTIKYKTPPLTQNPEKVGKLGGGGVQLIKFQKKFHMSEDEHEKKFLGKSLYTPDMTHIFQHYYTDPKKVEFVPHF